MLPIIVVALTSAASQSRKWVLLLDNAKSVVGWGISPGEFVVKIEVLNCVIIRLQRSSYVK